MTSDPTTNSVEPVTSVPLNTDSGASAPQTNEIAAAESTATTETARRVMLNPTGANLRAVASVDMVKVDRDIDAEAEREARRVRDVAASIPHGSIEVPLEENLDIDLEAEINAALAGSAATPPSAAIAKTAAAANSSEEDALEQGKRIKGKVALIHGEDVFLDLGFRSQGILPTKQYEGKELPAVGTEIEVTVQKVATNEGLIHVSLPSGKQRVSGNWDEVQAGMVVDCVVTKTNKGGLEVTVGSLRGFMPSGQVDVRFVENLETFVGQKLRVQITEANRGKRNLIVSRKAILEEERRAAHEKILATLEVGNTLSGTVKSVKDYGAFVDLGGVDGFLHIGQISWQHIKHPKEALAEGQAVQVKVISISEDKQKIGLSLKQLSSSPWEQAANNYFQGQNVNGKVSRITDFGAFIELEPGVEGMVHISELDHKRISRVADVVTVGQALELQVREVDPIKRRISLSLKALKAKPEAPKAEPEVAEEEVPAAPPPPRRKTPLKGGKEVDTRRSGGLFGNPSDFR